MTALYTSDIDCCARRMVSDANWFGTHPFDQAPQLSTVKAPFAFVLNNDASHLPGSHWLAFYQESSTLLLEMFDYLAFYFIYIHLKMFINIVSYSTVRIDFRILILKYANIML